MYGFVKFVKNLYQINIITNHILDRCKVYKDQLKSNCTGEEFKQQLKQYILNEVTMVFFDDLTYDAVNV